MEVLPSASANNYRASSKPIQCMSAASSLHRESHQGHKPLLQNTNRCHTKQLCLLQSVPLQHLLGMYLWSWSYGAINYTLLFLPPPPPLLQECKRNLAALCVYHNVKKFILHCSHTHFLITSSQPLSF